MESIIARYMRQRREFAYLQPSSYTERYLDDSHGDYTIMYQEVLQKAHDLHQPEPMIVLTRRSINRCRVEANARMMQDYFNPGCRFGPKHFKDLHGLPRELFLRLLPEICAQDEDFRQRRDACNIPGHSPHMKMLAVMKHLAKGVAADSLGDYTGMAASIIYMYVKKFMDALLWLFNDRYMRRATTKDTKRLLAENEARGFPGMLGSLDCTHWEWRCCPNDKAGRHVGQYKKPNLVLQVVASYDRWFWHFGLFDREKNALDPPCDFRINGHVYRHGYYLVDGIYNKMPGVVHGYKRRQTMPAIHKKFNEYHSAKRKDVERAFGGLKAKWGIIRNPCRYWFPRDLNTIMRACLIMHNMCVEYEYRDRVWARYDGKEETPLVQGNVTEARAYYKSHARWRHLQADITEHIWQRHIQGLRDGEVGHVEVHDALPISNHGTTDVDEDADIYPSDDDNFYQNGE
ncbi:uncharacterized protein LOC113360408 [Papaver somniferum]|uniref:uncharacterized protein LOC113360408 n=1 Tax=Papaver somniferum TaxID=3469 RepID=UPI000E703662|nr:uncharacterized protein LOC113360408 [Papaver somniferum]